MPWYSCLINCLKPTPTDEANEPLLGQIKFYKRLSLQGGQSRIHIVTYQGKRRVAKYPNHTSCSIRALINERDALTQLKQKETEHGYSSHLIRLIAASDDRGAPLILPYYSPETVDLHKSIELDHIQPHDDFGAILQITQGLYFMLSRGYLHRDIKPENILVKNQPDTLSRCPFTLILCDLGFAIRTTEEQVIRASDCNFKQQYKPTHTLSSQINRVGTLGYLAPEIPLLRRWTETTDVWALGVVFFNLVTQTELLSQEERGGHLTSISTVCNRFYTCSVIDNSVKLTAAVKEKIDTLITFTGQPQSQEKSHLIRRMLTERPSQRPSLAQLQTQLCSLIYSQRDRPVNANATPKRLTRSF